MLKEKRCKGLLELESDLHRGNHPDGPRLAWKLCLQWDLLGGRLAPINPELLLWKWDGEGQFCGAQQLSLEAPVRHF